MSLERIRLYDALRRDSLRAEKEAWSARLDAEYERDRAGKPDPYQNDPAVKAAEEARWDAFFRNDMGEYRHWTAVMEKAHTAVFQRIKAAAAAAQTATAPVPVVEASPPELVLTSPVAEKQPISAIRAEVCRVANELRKTSGMSRSVSMRTSWAMVKHGLCPREMSSSLCRFS